jgi:hypothetical protein
VKTTAGKVSRSASIAVGIQIEPKEKVIERIRRSPDCGDAVVLAHWLGGAAVPLFVDPKETSLVARLPEGVFGSADDNPYHTRW